MRAYLLLLVGLITSAAAGSALAQGATGGSFGASKGSTPGIDVNGATGGNRGASTGFGSGTNGGYSFQGSGLPSGVSGLPSLGAPPPSSATGTGFGGPPPRPTTGSSGALP